MNIGRKIYYVKSNGLIIWDKGELTGAVTPTTFEQDCQTMPLLSIIPPEELGVIQLEYGAYSQEFESARLVSIDAQGNLVFDNSMPPLLPDPIFELKAQNAQLKADLAAQNQALSDFMDYYFTMNPGG